MRASSSGICGMRNRSHTMDELLIISSSSSDEFGAKDDFATTSPPRRRRSLPSCVRFRKATAATAGCVNTVLLWGCWAALVVGKSLGDLRRLCEIAASGKKKKLLCSDDDRAQGWGTRSNSFDEQDHELGMCEGAVRGGGEAVVAGVGGEDGEGLSSASADSVKMNSGLGEGEEEEGSWREMRRRQKQLEQQQDPLQGDDDDGSSGLVEIEMSTFPLDDRSGAEGGLGRLPSLPLTLSCLQYQQGVTATTTRPSSARVSCCRGAADVGTAAASPPDDEGLDSTNNNNDPTPLPIVSEPESATASTASASCRTPSQDTRNSSSTCSSRSSCDDGEEDDSAATPSDLYRMRDITAGADNSPAPVAGEQTPAPMSSATGGDCCCCLCGYTLEEGQRVVRSPECAEGLMVSRIVRVPIFF